MNVDSVPVDTCANLTLVAAWETHKKHTNGENDIKVKTWSPDPKYIVFAGVQPHLKQHCAFEVGRDLRHCEGLPDEEPSWGDGLVPGGQLQTESCHQQVRTTSACQISKSKSLRDNDNFYILIRSIFYSTFSSFFWLFGFWGCCWDKGNS